MASWNRGENVFGVYPKAFKTKEVETYDNFVERFPKAIKVGWKLVHFPNKGSTVYKVVPPEHFECDGWIESWEHDTVKWAGMEIRVPQWFWDDGIMLTGKAFTRISRGT